MTLPDWSSLAPQLRDSTSSTSSPIRRTSTPIRDLISAPMSNTLPTISSLAISWWRQLVVSMTSVSGFHDNLHGCRKWNYCTVDIVLLIIWYFKWRLRISFHHMYNGYHFEIIPLSHKVGEQYLVIVPYKVAYRRCLTIYGIITGPLSAIFSRARYRWDFWALVHQGTCCNS